MAEVTTNVVYNLQPCHHECSQSRLVSKVRVDEKRPGVRPALYLDGRNVVNAISQLKLPIKKQSIVQTID